MEKNIDFLGKSAVSSTLYANIKNRRVEFENRYRDNTGFTLHHRLDSFAQMSSGSRNASSTVRKTLHVALPAVSGQLALVHLDAVVVISCYAAEHIDHVSHLIMAF